MSILRGIKNWVIWRKKEVIFAFTILTTAILSFGLGYLVNREFNHAPIVIEERRSN